MQLFSSLPLPSTAELSTDGLNHSARPWKSLAVDVKAHTDPDPVDLSPTLPSSLLYEPGHTLGGVLLLCNRLDSRLRRRDFNRETSRIETVFLEPEQFTILHEPRSKHWKKLDAQRTLETETHIRRAA